MKLALLLNAIDPTVGGALIMGHRGTAKSTAVRALSRLLPDLVQVKGCQYGCDPTAGQWCPDCLERKRRGTRLRPENARPRVVELPLGATEDRVRGSLDIERALLDGRMIFQPGLLARANRGFLYIDEVNLLEDHIVDLLLDVSASGWNIVEREGISAGHPARFVLIGSGNPEEGELRPQLLDRFGLYVKVTTSTDIDARMEIADRRERFDRDPAAFVAEMAPCEESLRARLATAMRIVSKAHVPRVLVAAASEVCIRLGIDGHRGEITMLRAARAHTAYEGRDCVTSFDLYRVAPLALRHRLRKDPLGSVDEAGRVQRALEATIPEARANDAA